MKDKKYIFFSLLFFLILGFFYKDNIFTTRFVDEEENFAVGKYLSNERLYDDILTSHQPLTYIFSAVLQKTFKFDDAFFLIKYHRIAVLIWSFVWSSILVSTFGLTALILTVVFELTKFSIFGNLFLPESFSVYPLILLMGLILRDKFNLKVCILFGLSLGICALLLLPLWPLLLFLMLMFFFSAGKQSYGLFKVRQNLKKILFFLIGILSAILPVLYFVSISHYIQIMMTNLFYTLPSYHQSYYGESWLHTVLKSFLSPFLALINPEYSTTSITLKLVSLLFFVNSGYLLLHKKYFISSIIFTILGLANLHFVNPGNESYAAGLLPWYGSFIFLSLTLAMTERKTNLKFLNTILIILTILISISLGGVNIFKKGDIQKDYFINFSTNADRGKAIKIMKQNDDTLFVSPDNWLVYWASDTSHLPKLMGYYAWMAGIPKIHQSILNNFEQKPPAFFYCENCKGLSLEKYLTKYKELKKNQGNTSLFVLSSKANNLTEDQIRELNYYQFGF